MTAERWNPAAYARHARFVSDFGVAVVDVLAPRAGERILDLGCGDGALTETLAAAGCRVVGIDSSPAQVGAARARGLDAHVADGQRLTYAAEFDAVFSNASLHWMKDQDAVIDGVWRALVPGGRFVAEMGGHGNVAVIVHAIEAALRRRGIDPAPLNPWVFPRVEDYEQRLRRRGFRVDAIALFERPTRLPGDVTGWLETFAQAFLDAVPVHTRPTVVAEIREALRPRLVGAEGVWIADYVRLRFRAIKSAQATKTGPGHKNRPGPQSGPGHETGMMGAVA
jgi:trans-aconitate methyltransferase